MTKNRVWLIVAGVLITASLLVVLYKNNVFASDDDMQEISGVFAIKDTNNITKIFVADMQGASVLLKRTPQGWTLNDTLQASAYYVEAVMGKLRNLTVREPVIKTAVSNINKRIAAGGTKVEVYQILPKFKLFGYPFFVKERLAKTYYFGPETQDNLGNYALLEGMDEPYIIYVPGFRGYISAQFSPYSEDWESHCLFSTKITRIETIAFTDLDNRNESFTVKKSGVRFFSLYNSENQIIAQYDTTKLLDMLAEFRSRNFETFVGQMRPTQKDSILQHNLFRIITLTDIDGKKTELRFYRLPEDEGIDPDENSAIITEYQFSRDRCYGVLNGNTSKMYYLQFFHFDRQMQPLSYFKYQPQ